ncbi:MAG TPA: hypothetical protein VLD39_02645 [Gammaproteobacteria bacterium]|nr:hypothetical protein [Gammaproteobacteria bacterium]
MTRLKLLAVLAAALAPGIASAWIEYRNMDHFFSVNFPREPDVRDFDYVSEYGATLPGHVYSVTDGGSRHTLTVVDFNDAEARYEEIADKTDDTTLTTMWIYDQRGAIAYEAAKLRARSSRILYDGWHHIDRVEGLNLVLENADGSTTYASLYLHARRLYILDATVPAGAPPQGLFQQSLSFLDADGNKIRYWITPEGERTRER